MTLKSDNAVLVNGYRCPKPEKEAELDRDQCMEKTKCSCKRLGGCLIKVPIILAVVGCGFMVLGGIPLSVTLAMGRRSSSGALIGLGFLGFGVMIMLLAGCWCLVTNCYSPCFTTPPYTLREDSVNDDKLSISV